jgi:DNA-directed RNA polymerase beta subunit
VKESFKIGKFTCKKKNLSSSELKSLLTQTKKQLKELSEQDQKKKKGLVEKLTVKIESLEQNNYQEWLIKETKGGSKIKIEILAQEKDNLAISFHYEQNQKADFCHLPKMTSQGDFIINGHHKVVVFQSVRAPAVYYYFGEEENKFLGEIIPFKGP